MAPFIWLTSIETSEPVGVPVARIAMIEQKSARDGHVVAVFLDTGKEVRVMEPLAAVQELLAGEAPEGEKDLS